MVRAHLEGRKHSRFGRYVLRNFIPGVGLLDEMVVIPIGVPLAAKMILPDVLEECTEEVRGVAEGEKPVNRLAAVVIVTVWLMCAALAVYLALRTF